MNNEEIHVIGGRNNGKTHATIQNLTVALNEERKKYRDLAKQYNEMVTVHNKLVDEHDNLVHYLKMQCGVLYTAITGDVRVDNPMKEISTLIPLSEGNSDLNYFREGIRLFILTYEETGSTQQAFEVYQNHIAGGN